MPATDDGLCSKTIDTAACLIIGDETRDKNSNTMAKWCFRLGISLKRIEVVPDGEDEIVEAVRRMSERYDFVVTSGGIGPTHDDITYKSVARAFNLPLVLHDEAYARMKKLHKPRRGAPSFSWDEDTPVRRARLKMVELPTDAKLPLEGQAIFPCDDMFVPVAVVNGNVHILPGVPTLFDRLLDGLTPSILPRVGKPMFRVNILTPLSESAIADYLTALAESLESKGIKVGSYPVIGKGAKNTVTLVGKDADYIKSITPDVAHNIQGEVVER
ncbi:putative FAD synthase [Madurella mycetomatis]|uniref:Putative FAD synthase n=1 Tax=Madurella mycetomatis TaxID=100816 RepID=A0A175W2F9_9PEZI|nr:putative FAD synthase [Madurella mycetomatis]KXX80216.1 putative FAD synthase [Madurella mycetomatis]